MPDTKRTLRWRLTPYQAGAVCDVCLSTTKVKIGTIPIILDDGVSRPKMKRVWSLCDSCHALGSGLLCTASRNGTLVFLSVRDNGGIVEHRSVFVPMMFRDRLF